MEGHVQGSGGVLIPGSVRETAGHGTLCLVDMEAFGQRLDLILEDFSNPKNSMNL